MMSWYREKAPIYDIHKTYLENLEQGPFFNAEIPPRPPSKPLQFLGHQVRSPLGVPAGPLLGSKWVALAARLGFDVITYKTIRSFAHPSHALPNMVYVEPTGPHTARQIPQEPPHIADLTVTNSFGMPSRDPDFLIQDIAAAQNSLSPDQLLIVSVVGTPNRGVTFLQDFIQTALFAKEAGAKVIEVNFSCPNVDKHEGILYMNPATVREYASAIRKAIHPVPLILKIGDIENPTLLREILHAAAGNAHAICGLNSISMNVTPPLGSGRDSSGVCGGAIRPRALHFIREAAKLIHKDKLDLTLMGCGGITEPAHFDQFLDAGAAVALTATGMMWDPLLALRYHTQEKRKIS